MHSEMNKSVSRQVKNCDSCKCWVGIHNIYIDMKYCKHPNIDQAKNVATGGKFGCGLYITT